MNFFKKLFGTGTTDNLRAVIESGAFLVDVRTSAEYSEGHVAGSVNIPLNTITGRLQEFSGKKNIIVFCRSGARSSQAKAILEQHGFTNVINGGAWVQVNQFVK